MDNEVEGYTFILKNNRPGRGRERSSQFGLEGPQQWEPVCAVRVQVPIVLLRLSVGWHQVQPGLESDVIIM